MSKLIAVMFLLLASVVAATSGTRLEPSGSGQHRYLIANEGQRAAVGEAISALMSQPLR
jgi:hypothetical protein